MSINSRFAMDPQKTKHLGPIFHTIDFEMNSYFSKEMYLEHTGIHKNRKVGTFFIDGIERSVTMRDLKRIVEDLKPSEDSVWRSRPKTVDITIFNAPKQVTRQEYFMILETAERALENVKKSYAMGIL